MKILLASSEVHPYSKTGGLADAVGALGKALARAGHRVGIVTPLYRGIREKFSALRHLDWHFDFSLGTMHPGGELWAIEPAKGLTVYFIHKPEYFDRPGIYNENGVDYTDNGERFIYFSKCVVNLAYHLPWHPDVVHASDWQTGLVPLMILHQSRAERLINAPRTCFTIHNLAFQGIFPSRTYELTNLPPDYFHPEGAEFYGTLNCLKSGIVFADVITTVSPRYAREITTEEYGENLDGLLRKRQNQLVGILNAVDHDEWSTTDNSHLRHPFSARALSGKAKNKAALQQELGLPVRPEVPLFGTITRLTEQKGMDIELGALEEMLGADLQFILMGNGNPDYERAFQELARRYPQRVAIRIGFNQGLSHRIEAGCDFYLMPSRFEPSGLNQLYSLRYGTIPIVRITGGLDDSVVDASENLETANGIKFMEYSAPALARAMRKALTIYERPSLLRRYRVNGMKADFSWDRNVPRYLRAYEMAKTSRNT